MGLLILLLSLGFSPKVYRPGRKLRDGLKAAQPGTWTHGAGPSWVIYCSDRGRYLGRHSKFEAISMKFVFKNVIFAHKVNGGFINRAQELVCHCHPTSPLVK